MKICWDNLERVIFSHRGNFVIGKDVYVEMDLCKTCGNPYLAQKRENISFCSISCAKSGKNNVMYGKTHTIEEREKIVKRFRGVGPNYKGGVCKLGLTLYDTYKGRLEVYEDVRKQKGTEILETKCAYCGSWFSPTRVAVNNRLDAINHLNKGEMRLYCSENCKQSCPTYNQTKYPKGFKNVTSREVSTYLRQMVFERDNWRCQKCGKTTKEMALHCHHMDPVIQNPLFQNDMDSCIALCKECHKSVHIQHGCRYADLKCKKGEGLI